jgi:hypothetical protein
LLPHKPRFFDKKPTLLGNFEAKNQGDDTIQRTSELPIPDYQFSTFNFQLSIPNLGLSIC